MRERVVKYHVFLVYLALLPCLLSGITLKPTERKTGKRYELWRQDDNGNRFLIEVHDDRRIAENRMAELGGHPHKQMYWISEFSEFSR